jgi:hypothetical protein
MPLALVWLTRRALERGPAEPSNALSVITQGYAMTSGRRERSSPSLSTLCGQPRHCSAMSRTAATLSTLLRCTGTGRHHTYRCTLYGPPSTTPSSLSADDDRTANRYATTLEAAPVRAQDVPRRHDWNEIHQDGRQLHDIARHASTCRRIVRYVCKSSSPWPIKGREIPQPQGTTTRDDGQRSHARFPPSPRYWQLPQSIPLGLGGQTSSPTTLVAPSTSTTVQRNTVPRAHHCWTYGPGRNQDKPSVFSC